VQFAWLADGGARAAGLKLRSKFIMPPGWHPHLRLGINVELSRIPAVFEPSIWGGEVRPIIAWEDDRFLLAANPNLGLRLGGSDQRPTAEPGAMIKVKLGEHLAAGVEYYGSLGPLWAPDRLAEQEHYLFACFDLPGFRGLELNAGLGAGLTGASRPVIAKAILGYVFE
jgi:hypothetical protein